MITLWAWLFLLSGGLIGLYVWVFRSRRSSYDPYLVKTVTTAAYVMTSRAYRFYAVHTLQPCVLTLPAARIRYRCTIVDKSGHADEFPITIRTQEGDRVNGGSELVVNDAYNSVTLVSDGVDTWFLV